MDALYSGHCYRGFLAAGSSRRRALSSKAATASPCARFLQPPPPPPSSVGAAISLRHPIPWILPVSSHSPPSPEAGEDSEESLIQTGVESGIYTPYQTKTVHVRFVLPKTCQFGEQFLIVGDDPIFGLWDPLNAVPLEWSEGHVWTAEMDIPVGKSIQFKFILRDINGEINWQPGPDRLVELWETTNTIVITDDWENAENHKIAEDFATVTEEAASTESQIGINSRSVIPEIEMGIFTGTTGGIEEDKLPKSTRDEDELANYQGDLVLVPGLTRAPVSATASVFPEEVINGMMADASLASDEAERYNSLQLSKEKEEPSVESVPNWNLLEEEEEGTEIMASSDKAYDDSHETSSHFDISSEEKRDLEDPIPEDQPTDDVLRNVLLWGRKMLHQLLLNLGFEVNLFI